MATARPALTTPALHATFAVAERWLALNREAINAVNVYPVPDGDTGTNMLLTWRSALEGAAGVATGPLGAYGARLARAALLGARGNSGVILSQFVRGLVAGLEDAAALDGARLARCLDAGAEAAYAAVSVPVEGTMLTVLRDAARAARTTADGGARFEGVLSAAVVEADASVERTPTLLPRLREAGVVDAGGLGVAVLLRGIWFGLRGDALPEPPLVEHGAVDLDAVAHEGHGYCIEFVLLGEALDRDRLAHTLEAAGAESVLVVGDPDALHVHAHLDDPGPALSIGAQAGLLDSVKIDNMQLQHEAWTAAHEAASEVGTPAFGLVAVLPGDGLAAVLRGIGPVEVVAGGRTMNPSAGEIATAAQRAATVRAFVLPNDTNVLMAARQAAEASPDLITVVPTTSVPAGIAAAFAFRPDGNPEAIAARMTDAAAGVRTIEVTRAVRAALVDEVPVEEGDAIALLDGRLAARAATLEDALLEALDAAIESAEGGAGAEVVTVYLGADAPGDAATELPALISERWPHVELEVVAGGQPHYPYLVGVE